MAQIEKKNSQLKKLKKKKNSKFIKKKRSVTG